MVRDRREFSGKDRGRDSSRISRRLIRSRQSFSFWTWGRAHLAHFFQVARQRRKRATSWAVGSERLTDDHEAEIELRKRSWSAQHGSYRKKPRFGTVVEIVATRGTWSEVSRVREARAEEGKSLTSQYRLQTQTELLGLPAYKECI
jgi:hypothetical protein